MTVELLCLARCRKKSGVSDFKILEAFQVCLGHCMSQWIIKLITCTCTSLANPDEVGGRDIEAASPLLNFKKSKKCYNEKRQKHKKMK